MVDQIFIKFCVDIICRIGTCRTIQSYSPSSATFPDSFASFSKPVAVTTVARSAVFPSFDRVWAEISTPTWQPHWASRCSGGPARSLQPGVDRLR